MHRVVIVDLAHPGEPRPRLAGCHGVRLAERCGRRRCRGGHGAGRPEHDDGAAEREQERFHDINRRSLKQGVASTRLEAQMFRSVEMTLAAGLALEFRHTAARLVGRYDVAPATVSSR